MALTRRGAGMPPAPSRPDVTPPEDTRLYLSPPHLNGEEIRLIEDALASNWVAPLGPHVDAFETEFSQVVQSRHAVALSSGTAALHLGLRELGVGPDDEVIVSSLTFAASAFPITYLGATPVFVDSEAESWNMDPNALEDALDTRIKAGKRIKAVVVVHVYGQMGDLDRLQEICARRGVPVVEDAAESLGSAYRGRPPGTFGRWAAFSFNGNKIITTSGGGMLVTDDEHLAGRVRKLANQAREPEVHYQHAEVGYNYRFSNLLAAVGRAQLRTLDDRVARRRAIFDQYRTALADVDGLSFMPEAPWARHTRWLSVFTLDGDSGARTESLRRALESENIEARPVWKPLHLQPVFEGAPMFGGRVAERLFREGLCLPSGSSMTSANVDRVARIVRSALRGP